MDQFELMFLKELKKVDLEEFNFMLNNNILFCEYIKYRFPDTENILKSLKFAKYVGFDEKKLNPKNILNLISLSNKNAYNLIINHYNGRDWLNKSIEQLRKNYL